MTRLALAAAAAALCLIAAACVGGRPIHYYTIDYPAQAPVAAKPDGAVLLVGRITVPEALQDSRIRFRAGGNEVGAYEYHRWTERPGVVVQDLLLHALRTSGRFRQVQEASSAAAGDFVVRGRLYEFSEIDDPRLQSRVSLRLELLNRKSGLVVWDHHYERDEPVDGKTMQEVVRSLEHNLRQVVGNAASGIETFLSSQN